MTCAAARPGGSLSSERNSWTGRAIVPAVNSSIDTDGRPRQAQAADRVEACARAIDEVVPRTMRLIRRAVRNQEAETGLTDSQLRLLLQVARRPGVSLSAVSEHLGISRPAGSALVDRLVRSGQLDRSVDPAERRRLRLRVTADGEETIARAQRHAHTWLQRELADLTEAELEVLEQALAILGRIGAENSSGR